eukprot:Colp12_sorted_trinity150504_noHs@13047
MAWMNQLVLQVDGEIKEVGHSVCELLQYKSDELLGKKAQLVWPTLRQGDITAELLARAGTFLPSVCKDGSEAFVYLTDITNVDCGGKPGFSFLVRDCTYLMGVSKMCPFVNENVSLLQLSLHGHIDLAFSPSGKILGRPVSQVQNRPLMEFIADEELPSFCRYVHYSNSFSVYPNDARRRQMCCLLDADMGTLPLRMANADGTFVDVEIWGKADNRGVYVLLCENNGVKHTVAKDVAASKPSYIRGVFDAVALHSVSLLFRLIFSVRDLLIGAASAGVSKTFSVAGALLRTSNNVSSSVVRKLKVFSVHSFLVI